MLDADTLQIQKPIQFIATWMKLCQTIDHIYIYKGLSCLEASDPTL